MAKQTKRQPAQDAPGMAARVALQDELLAKASALRDEVAILFNKESQLVTELREKSGGLMQRRQAAEAKGLRDGQIDTAVADDQQAVDELASHLRAVRARAPAANEELRQIEVTLAQAGGVQCDEVLACQAKVADAENAIATLDAAVEEQMAASAALKFEDSAAMQREIEDIQALIAMGEGDAEDCKRRQADLAEKIDAANRRNEFAREESKRMQATVNGLHRRRDLVVAELTKLREEEDFARYNFMVELAEAEAREYVALAEKLNASLIRIFGLTNASRTVCGRAIPLAPDSFSEVFRLPSLRSNTGRGQGAWPQYLFSELPFVHDQRFRERAISEAKDRIRAMGIAF